MPSLPDSLRPVAIAVAAILALALAFALRTCGGETVKGETLAVPGAPPDAEPFVDPFSWDPDREAEFVQRAADGHAHGLYKFSPGGIVASAERTARWRPRVEEIAAETGVDPDRLEGLILLESAGREDAMTSFGTEGAIGLVQIVAGTATTLLGMNVDVAESRRLTKRIAAAERKGDDEKAEDLREHRRTVDERYDPQKALRGAGRYLGIALDRYDREDLAFVSYHMGMGNLDGVLAAYGEPEPSWAQVYFDSSPTSHPEAWAKLSGFADDSLNYLWKVEAAMDVMELYRTDRAQLGALDALHGNKASAEEVLHPQASTRVLNSPDELREAYGAGDIVPLPAVEGLSIDPGMGELAKRVDAEPSLYRGLRPEALALAIYISAKVREIAPGTTLRLTSTVRDVRYQQALVSRNSEATKRYSLHTTGWAFDVARDYRDREHARAFQFVLDRLRALNLISWVREPGAIHITAGPDAERLRGLLDRVDGG